MFIRFSNRRTRFTLAILTALFSIFILTNHADAQKKKKKKPPIRWMKMQLGPTFSSTISVPSRSVRNIHKAIAIRLGENDEAAAIFDIDLLRLSAGWTGGFVNIHAGRDALLGNDSIRGSVQWATPAGLAWAKNGKFDDPRKVKFGPLPKDWAKYRGLYMHGKRVVLSYTVGPANVLEHPWVESSNSITSFTRTFNITSATNTLSLAALDTEGQKPQLKATNGVLHAVVNKKSNVTAIALAPGSANVTLATSKRGLIANIPSSSDTKIKFHIWTGPKSDLPKFLAHVKASSKPADLSTFTKGGAPRWPHKPQTTGQLGSNRSAYTVDTITAPYDNPYGALLYFGGFDFFSDGSAAICTMQGDVWTVQGIDSSLSKLTWQRIATGMYHPLGLKIVKDKVYVLCRDQIVRLHDLNGDGETDFYESFNNDCQVGTNSHEFATGLETDPQGNFYYMKGTNNSQTQHDGTVIKVSKDGSKLEVYATGFRWPNGMGMSPTGVLSAADQQGGWVPSSRIDLPQRNTFHGYMPSHHRKTKPIIYDGPLVWIPHKVDNSCGGQTWVDSDKWGPLKGKMMHLSYGRCRLFLTLQEKVDGQPQGGVILFPVKKFNSGSMRARFNPKDGQFYHCGLKGWQTSGARDGGFQRVRYTGKKTYLPVGLNVKTNGIVLTFADKLDRELAEDPDSYAAERWNYQWTKRYGSPEFSVKDPKKRGHDKITIQSAKLAADGKTVFIEMDDLKRVMQQSIKFNLEATDGEPVTGTIYHTIHKLGK